MTPPDPAREAAILARCAVCGGGTEHGMLVHDLAGAWGHAMLLDCLASLKAQLAAARARAERAEFVMVQAAIPLEALHADNRDGAKWMCPDLRQAVANAVEAIRRALAARGE